jgi:hypothetical protein
MIRAKFETIKDTDFPQQVRSWKCSKLCSAGKTTYEGTDVKVMGNMFGAPLTKCQQTAAMIKENGIEWVTSNCMSPDHEIGKYKAPGEV